MGKESRDKIPSFVRKASDLSQCGALTLEPAPAPRVTGEELKDNTQLFPLLLRMEEVGLSPGRGIWTDPGESKVMGSQMKPGVFPGLVSDQ